MSDWNAGTGTGDVANNPIAGDWWILKEMALWKKSGK